MGYIGTYPFFTNLTGSAADTADLSMRVGAYGTIGVEYRVSPRFGLSAEASLLQKGAKQSTADTQPGLGYRIVYVEFPLLAKWNLSPTAELQPVLLAGPSFAFEIDCKMPFLYVNSVIDSKCYRGMWFVNARYMMGFTSLLSGDGAPGLKNSGFLAGLGLTF